MTARAASWRATCLSSAALLLALTGAVAAWGLLPGEAALREGIVARASPLVTAVAAWVNPGGSWPVLLPVMALLLDLCREARRRWWLWCAMLLLTGALEEGGKSLVARPRPEALAFGFPSGHATAAAALGVLGLYLVGRPELRRPHRLALQALVVLLVLLVGLARVVLRAHWPADVLGGFALGGRRGTASRRSSGTSGRSRTRGPRSSGGRSDCTGGATRRTS